jgi:hypothetical protein
MTISGALALHLSGESGGETNVNMLTFAAGGAIRGARLPFGEHCRACRSCALPVRTSLLPQVNPPVLVLLQSQRLPFVVSRADIAAVAGSMQVSLTPESMS